MALRAAPCTVKAAKKWVKALHRHFPIVHGGLFAVAVVDESGQVRGVGIAGLPPPTWEGSGKIVVSRIATDGARNACSLIYGSLCRAAQALGYSEAWTYTLPEENGASLRASGFAHMGETDGRGDWSRPNIGRHRDLPGFATSVKQRWMRKLR